MKFTALSGSRSRVASSLKHAFVKPLLTGLAALALAPAVNAEAMLDCPLRDEPYSLSTPVLDVLLNPKAKAVLEKHLPEFLAKAPPMFLKTEAPAFGAIMSVQSMAGMGQASPELIKAIAKDLAKVKLTDADRVARCARYDNEQPEVELPNTEKRVLVFTKINGFDHGISVKAATHSITALAEQQGWGVVVTDKGGAFTPEFLANFDAVVWNNNSGDVLTLSQRKAFKKYIESGGGFLGIHGAGGDPSFYWDWYVEKLIGATFIGHPNNPQFQTARIDVAKNATGVGQSLAPGWSMNDEWYSFAESARKKGVSIIATLDESTYDPGNIFGRDLHMGEDHPIVWSQCVKKGRSLYTAIGHRAEVYHLPENLILLRDALQWVIGDGENNCR